MKLSLLLAAVIAVPACTSPSPPRPDLTPSGGRAATVDSAAPAAPPARLVVLTPTGDLGVLDGETGAVRSQHPAGAVDLALDQDHPDRLATIETADDQPGRLARHRLRADQLERIATFPFDAESGRLLRAGDAIVGLAQTEMSTLFWTRQGQGRGKVWGPILSAATIATADTIQVQSAGWPDGPSVSLQTARLSERGVEGLEVTEVSAPRSTPALFALPGGFGRVDTTPNGWRVVGGPHDGFEMEAPDEFPVEACLLDGRRLAVLTGPEARLRVLSVWGVGEVALGDERLEPLDQIGHRLAFDAGRQRVWALAGRTAYAVAVPSMAVVARGEGAAIALAVVTPGE